ncbi:hypothetical protein AVEN_113518-1, partial [Araneus ventricosus]
LRNVDVWILRLFKVDRSSINVCRRFNNHGDEVDVRCCEYLVYNGSSIAFMECKLHSSILLYRYILTLEHRHLKSSLLKPVITPHHANPIALRQKRSLVWKPVSIKSS